MAEAADRAHQRERDMKSLDIDPNHESLPLEELVKKYPDSPGLKLLLARQMAAQKLPGEDRCLPPIPSPLKELRGADREN